MCMREKGSQDGSSEKDADATHLLSSRPVALDRSSCTVSCEACIPNKKDHKKDASQECVPRMYQDQETWHAHADYCSLAPYNRRENRMEKKKTRKDSIHRVRPNDEAPKRSNESPKDRSKLTSSISPDDCAPSHPKSEIETRRACIANRRSSASTTTM